MKTITIILINLFILSSILGQNIDRLDKKNGFKDFTLGDSYAKWQNQLASKGSWDDGTKAYLYVGQCCQKVFDYPINKIILRFDNNKLVGIYITTEKFQKEYSKTGKYTEWRDKDYESLKSSFSYLFGKPTSIKTDKDSGSITYIWGGNKAILFSKYEYLGVNNGDQQQIFILDGAFLNKGLEDGF